MNDFVVAFINKSDGLDRLVSSERADDYDQSWTLDGLGNFAEFDDDGDTQTRATNEANEIESITGGWVSPEYDDAGNMIYGPKSGEETTGLHFVRDAWNRLVAVYEDDGDGSFEPATDDTLLAEYEFDAANRRIEKVLSASHAHYFYNNSWQLLEERVSPIPNPQSLISINQHVFSPDYIDSPIVWRHDANGDGDYLDEGDCLRYYLSDANRNTTAVVDSASGLVVNRYVYNAYGMHTVYDAAWSNPAAPTSDGILYCGYWRDAETGNYQVRAREYVTCLSTFDARDPIGYYANDANLYRYVYNNPVIYVDPLGFIGIFFDGAGRKRGEPTIMQSMYNKYTDAAAIFYTKVWPNNIWANIRKAHEIVCKAICDSVEGCPPQPTEPVDLFGWSRGAVAALTLAKRLNNMGCVSDGKTFKPIKIRFMGLIDPVETSVLPMIGTNSSVVPSNVENVHIVYAGLINSAGKWFFVATHPKPEDETATSASSESFAYIHQVIGFTTATEVQNSLENAAIAAGVPLK